MALPSSGQISLSQVAVELGRASNATTSLGESAVRSLAGVPSGAISLDNLHGKSSAWAGTITTNQQEINLASWASANGWDGSTAAIITIASGVYIWSDNTATPALTVNGSWPGGLTIVNNGYIMGRGGDGGGYYPTGIIASSAGGPAISTTLGITIDSAIGYIGGGGGGGGAQTANGAPNLNSGAGGAGGGKGGGLSTTGGVTAQPIPGGAIGNSGANGTVSAQSGSGGRIMPGSTTAGAVAVANGTVIAKVGSGGTAGGSGGAYISSTQTAALTQYGGSGGGSGNTGASGSYSGTSNGYSSAAGGGGGYGASGGNAEMLGTWKNGVATSGSAGGKAINTNGNAITWSGGFPSTHVFGAVS